jgi:hypothetical protein
LKPFDFIILFFSFVYALALTHLLLAAARMVRHRKSVVFSWPHALWMLDALLILASTWLSFWDVHQMGVVSVATVAAGFVVVITQYLLCALVAPDFTDGNDFDLRGFHERERATYLVGFLVVGLLALAANLAGAVSLGVRSWANQNWLVLAMFLPVLAALFLRRTWIQVTAPLVFFCLQVAFTVVFYPSLR